MQLSKAAHEPPIGLAGWLTPHAQYWYLQVGLVGLGGVLVIAGFNLDLPLVIDAGALTLAAAAVASGLASILTRRIVFLWPSQRYHLVAWHGGAAVLVGLGFLVLGLAIGLAVFAHLAGSSLDQIRDTLLERPWRALIPMGFFMLSNGLAIIIGFKDRRDPKRGALWNLIMTIPNQLGGLIGSTFGPLASNRNGSRRNDNPDYKDGIELLNAKVCLSLTQYRNHFDTLCRSLPFNVGN